MNELSGRDCVPCRGGVPPLEEAERETLKAQLDPDWEVVEGHHLQREFQFEDFRTAMDFTVRVGEMAETQGHHPDLYLAWGKARVVIWTHKIDGLTESDFIFAARTDTLFPASS